jgi:DNA/RNA endonuclease YhcR with UshA esterase domain
MNESLSVTGKIAQVSFTSRIVYLNLEKKYPEAPFTGVIFNDKTNEFSGLEKLNGKQVELVGKVTEYRDRPQMVLTNSNQIQVVEKAESAEKK